MERSDAAGLALIKDTRFSVRNLIRRNSGLGIGMFFIVLINLACIYNFYEVHILIWVLNISIYLFMIAFLCIGPMLKLHIKIQKQYYLFSTLFVFYAIYHSVYFILLSIIAIDGLYLEIDQIFLLIFIFELPIFLTSTISIIKKLEWLKKGRYKIKGKLYRKIEKKEFKKTSKKNNGKAVGFVTTLIIVVGVDNLLDSVEGTYSEDIIWFILSVLIYGILITRCYKFSDHVLATYCKYKFEDFNSPKDVLLSDWREKVIHSDKQIVIRIILGIILGLLSLYFLAYSMSLNLERSIYNDELAGYIFIVLLFLIPCIWLFFTATRSEIVKRQK